MEIRVSSKKILKCLIICVGLLLAAHTAVQILRYGFGFDVQLGLWEAFDLNEETNIPTVFSFLLFGISADLLALISFDAFKRRRPFANHWAGLSIVFAWLALDELLMLHEGWSFPLRIIFKTGGFLHFMWIVPYMLFVAVLGAVYLRFFKSLPNETKRLFGLALALFIAGAVGCELFEGWCKVAFSGEQHKIYNMLFYSLEEVLEMSGLVAFIYALLEYIRSHVRELSLRWED